MSWTTLVGPAHGRYVSFRADSVGGAARQPPILGEGFSLRRRLILLVHGFNVNEAEAYASYRAFEHQLATELGSERWAEFCDDVLWVLWPGDSRLLEGFSPFALIKQTIYGPRVAYVQEWAPYLGEWLARLKAPAGEPCELILVGHSLGCRVILEALRSLPDSSARENPILLLMLLAAAVPVAHLEEEGRLRRAAERAIERDVLHSTRDTILQAAFRIGQHFGETFVGGIAPEAVGIRGNPGSSLWTSDKPMWIKHSEYWGHPVVARRLLHHLHIIGTAGPRERVPVERQDPRPWRSPPMRRPFPLWRPGG